MINEVSELSMQIAILKDENKDLKSKLEQFENCLDREGRD